MDQPNSPAAKKTKRLRQYMKNKLSAAYLIIALALFALAAYIFYIQNNNAEEYTKTILSQRQSQYQSVTIPYRRGDIYDRNGTRLASSERVYILILDPKQMNEAEYPTEGGEKAKNVIDPTVAAIADFFGEDASDIRETIYANPSSAYIRYKRDISYLDKVDFEEYIASLNASYEESDDAATRMNKITGVWFEEGYKRIYPYGSLACNVIGFANAAGDEGVGGVEQYYNSTLIGVNGREYGYLDDESDLEKVIKPVENGSSLVLTIDANVQNIVENYLSEWDQGEIGSKSAACIVMNVKNGEVLAMASTRTFDLNDPYTTGSFTDDEIYDFGLSEAIADFRKNNPDAGALTADTVPDFYTYDEIMSLGRVAAMYQNWRNIAVSETFEPGSTQKIFTVAGALEESVISENTAFECTGSIHLSDGVNDWTISCVNRYGHGLLDVTGGITQSCNVVMMNIAFAEGAADFVKYEKLFGFNGYTGIDLPAETNTASLGFSDDTIGKTQLATNAFGQNYNCTMIQMAAAYCSILNGGHYYKPHVVSRILTEDGALKESVEPLLVKETVSEETCQFLIDAMVETVENGTGTAAKVPGYSVGGKTGTAEKQPRSAKKYLVSFCGFAPAEDPAILCYVIVDEPDLPGEEAAHSSFASGIFAKIMAEALPALGYYPEEGTEVLDNVGTLLPEEEGDSRTPMGNLAEEESEGLTVLSNLNGEPVTETLEANDAVYQTKATDEYITGDEDDLSEVPDLLPEIKATEEAPQPE